MIAVIRISGQVKIREEFSETLNRLGLRKKYNCIVFPENAIQIGMLKKVKNFVAYGTISEETFIKLIEVRGKKIDSSKKIDNKKIWEELKAGKKYKEIGLKPVFHLHPPRKGIDSKKHFGVNKGVLGNNKEKINDLIRRML